MIAVSILCARLAFDGHKVFLEKVLDLPQYTSGRIACRLAFTESQDQARGWMCGVYRQGGRGQRLNCAKVLG